MSAFVVKGWCPDAWRPMMAGDGLLVRIRPPLGRVTREQTLGLCDAAATHGNGLIDLTSRANLQIRGVRKESWRPLIDTLLDLGLIDPDPIREARANILVAPEWRPGDDTHRIAELLRARLADLPELPGKIGFAIDAGVAPVLQDAPADFRIERAASGTLILRADGRTLGTPVSPGTEADRLIALAYWFVDSGGTASGRMVRHGAPLPDWAAATTPPAASAPPLGVGQHALGRALGLPFGRIVARALARYVDTERAIDAIRTTPWHIAICEADAALLVKPDPVDFITDPASPALHADACVGAPVCPQGSVETRALALRLAPHITGRLHVSGCAKGCARAAPADVTLTGREGRYDLAFDARAGAPPSRAGLDVAQILAQFGAA
ncbi:precorrin-3B synthase [Sphingomonas sp. PP-CE-1A-559]|uniref:cobalamin biosynthesis protein CobG n=1 Tax=Sphingomonas sp. PP-CE-1A-559 TaxID=2135657 RepID=UPI00105563E2|nr:cobalamin biosynthesis protein CobG [Sphingomonas sp. PP-CE-1A-559]TCP92987.1 precorrin-3B synthase [Sphingomonas sp. PP-CE-1A-559]